MNSKYQPHESSLGGLQANIVVLFVWLGPAILSIFLPAIGYLGLIVPVVFLFIEKKSGLVREHAGQALGLYVFTNILMWILTFVLGIVTAGSIAATAATNSSAGAAVGFGAVGITGIVILVIGIAQLVFVILACIKGWNWESYTLPIVGNLGKWFTEKIKIN